MQNCRIWSTEWKGKSNEGEVSDRMDQGFQNEESARKLVQNNLAAMKKEIRQIKQESGSTVCSEASSAASGTFARPLPSIAGRYNETFGLQTTQEVARWKRSLLLLSMLNK